jgi:tetratricopeptide (TPR) repeat protein
LVALTRTGKVQDAIDIGERARTLFPQENEVVLYNLALAYRKAGNTARFLACMQDVLRINPRSDSAHLQLGMYYLQQERNGREARKHLQEALRLNPDLPQAALIRQWLAQYR